MGHKVLEKYFLNLQNEHFGIEGVFAVEDAVLLSEVVEEILEEHRSRFIEGVFFMEIGEKQTEEFLIPEHDHVSHDIDFAVSFLGNDREQILRFERKKDKSCKHFIQTPPASYLSTPLHEGGIFFIPLMEGGRGEL